MNETEFSKAYMNSAREYECIETDFTLEAHYNHYGSRGAVDIVSELWETSDSGERYGPSIEVVELKSESAVEQATGANEIIRQFKKHINYFFDGTSKFPRRKYNNRTFWLLFHATPRTVKHARENVELYKNVEDSYEQAEVGLWNEDSGTVRFTNEDFWQNGKSAKQMRQAVGYDKPTDSVPKH